MNWLSAAGNAFNAILRGYVWVVLVACYALGIQATFSALAGDGAKLLSSYNLLAVVLGVPTLVGYAGSLWLRSGITAPLERVEVALCAAYPVSVIAVGGMYVLLRGVA